MQQQLFNIWIPDYERMSSRYLNTECASTDNILIPLTPFIESTQIINSGLTFYNKFNGYSLAQEPCGRGRMLTQFAEVPIRMGTFNVLSVLQKRAPTPAVEPGMPPVLPQYYRYRVFPNMLTDSYGVILAMMCFYPKYNREVRKLITEKDSVTYEGINKNYFCLVLNQAIFTEEHKTLLRSFSRSYIDVCREQGISIMETSSINNICFNEATLQLPRFSTLQQEEDHLKTITALLYENTAEETLSSRSSLPWS